MASVDDATGRLGQPVTSGAPARSADETRSVEQARADASGDVVARADGPDPRERLFVDTRSGADADADPEDDESTDPDAEPAGATTMVPAARPELRDCPNCEAPNSARRNICGRCGADLATGAVPEATSRVVATGSGSDGSRRGRPGPDHLEGEPPRTGRVVALVVVVGVLLGALIGGLIALDAGPFGDDAPVEEALPEPPPFDQARYDAPSDTLTVAAIGATTTHGPLGDETYDAARMVDRELDTAWNNDGARNSGGVGEVIAVEFAEPVRVAQVVLGNGAQVDDAAFLGHARIERARIRFDGGVLFEVTFLDTQQLQSVELPTPVLTTGATIDVLSVYAGDTYEDLAVSELRFLGWPAQGPDVDAAEQRAGA